MRLVLASNNAKKLAELKALFAALPLDIVTQDSLGVAEAEEPHHTFIENALAKARHAAQATGGAAIAADSVDHLKRYVTMLMPRPERKE